MHADKAEALYQQNFNCAQAVFGAFAAELGVDFETAMKVASSLGGGIAHTGEACGAAIGMCLAVGMAKGYADNPDKETKDAHNARVKAMMEAFRAKFGHMDCDDLRAPGNRAVCFPYVRYAAELVEKEIKA